MTTEKRMLEFVEHLIAMDRTIDAALIKEAYYHNMPEEEIRVNINTADELASLTLVSFDRKMLKYFQKLFPMELKIARTSVNIINWLSKYNEPYAILYNAEGDFITGKIETYILPY